MGDMENSELDSTLPTQANSVDGGEPDLDATIRTNVEQNPEDMAQAGAPSLSESASGKSEAAAQPVAKPPSKGKKTKKNSKGKKGKRSTWPIIVLLGMLILLFIAATSAFGGYASGIAMRKDAEATQVVARVKEQFDLGLQELEQGNYNRARQRFEYVIQLDPNYPGVTEKLVDVMLRLNATATPTIVPTPTVSPTPDMRTVQQLYDQGQQYMLNADWSNAIDALLALRKADPTFQPVLVDDMLFIALRNRGIDKITKQADLEGGIYDLTLAERFGPIDSEAQGLLNWTKLYITGASFWDLNWEQAVYYFAQVAAALPHLTDGSGMSANERYRVGLIKYGDQLMNEAKYCQAMEKYQLAQTLGNDPAAAEALIAATNGCNTGSTQPQPTAQKTPKKKP